MVLRGGETASSTSQFLWNGRFSLSPSEHWSRSWRSAASICSEVELRHCLVSGEKMLSRASSGTGSGQQGQTCSPFPRENHRILISKAGRALQDHQIQPLAKYAHPLLAGMCMYPQCGWGCWWGLHIALELLYQSISLSSLSCLSGSFHCIWGSVRVLITLCSFPKWVLQCFPCCSWGILQNC